MYWTLKLTYGLFGPGNQGLQKEEPSIVPANGFEGT